MTPIQDRLRKAAQAAHTPPLEDVLARTERQDILEELLLEAASAIDSYSDDASMAAWGDVIERLVNMPIELTGEDGEFFEERVSGGARVTFFYHTLAALRNAGYRIVKVPDEAE